MAICLWKDSSQGHPRLMHPGILIGELVGNLTNHRIIPMKCNPINEAVGFIAS